ncbi:MAG TPA: hypothetical protein VIG33_16845 [Pseudobdellovibrionaceae bacterium]|jgi:hypothetical protein
MRILNLMVLVLTLAVAGFSKAAPKYPRIAEVQGKVTWTNKDKQEEKIKVGRLLSEKAALETDVGQIAVQIDAHRRLHLYSHSRLEIPSISWETGETPVILLKWGSFRWQEAAGKTYNVALSSDLFEFLSPQGNFVFSFDPKKAVAEVKVIKGSMEFSALNGEDTALVTAGQKCRFQGVQENDEIVYDVLLKGKKIPRGKLELVQNFSKEEKKLYSEAQQKKEKVQRLKKEQAEKNSKEPPRSKDEICDQPRGKFNQCAWVCENNAKKEKKTCRLEVPEVHCIRQRCNASGEWAEKVEIPKDKASIFCSAKALVKECDY